MSKKKKERDEGRGTRGEKVCEKCVEYEGGWKRALADYDNLKKNLAKEKDEMRVMVKEDLVHRILPVLDNFDQAVKFKPDGLDASVESWLQGILHVKTQLEDTLVEIGAKTYGQEGEAFDPNLHDAVSEESDESKDDQIILEIAQRGWKIADKVVRPAKVVINNIKK